MDLKTYPMDGLMKVKKVKAGTAFEFNNETVKSLEWSESRGVRLFFDKTVGLLFLQHVKSNGTLGGLWAFGLPNIAFMQFFDEATGHIPKASTDIAAPRKEIRERDRPQSARVVVKEAIKEVAVRRGVHGDNDMALPPRRRSYKESDTVKPKKGKVNKNLEIDPDLND